MAVILSIVVVMCLFSLLVHAQTKTTIEYAEKIKLDKNTAKQYDGQTVTGSTVAQLIYSLDRNEGVEIIVDNSVGINSYDKYDDSIKDKSAVTNYIAPGSAYVCTVGNDSKNEKLLLMFIISE